MWHALKLVISFGEENVIHSYDGLEKFKDKLC